MSPQDIISIPYTYPLKTVSNTCLSQPEYCVLSMICLLAGLFGQIKPLFAFTHSVTVPFPMSEMELRRF